MCPISNYYEYGILPFKLQPFSYGVVLRKTIYNTTPGPAHSSGRTARSADLVDAPVQVRPQRARRRIAHIAWHGDAISQVAECLRGCRRVEPGGEALRRLVVAGEEGMRDVTECDVDLECVTCGGRVGELCWRRRCAAATFPRSHKAAVEVGGAARASTPVRSTRRWGRRSDLTAAR